jgi:hypothetical protein
MGCLPKEAQEKWDQLDHSSKAIILEHNLRPPQVALCKVLLGATLEGPLEVVSPPGIVQLILQSTYMRSVQQTTLLTTIRCPLANRLMTANWQLTFPLNQTLLLHRYSPTWQRRRISTQETSTESFHSPWPRAPHHQQGNWLCRTV